MLPTLNSCTARKVNTEQPVAAGRESTGKQEQLSWWAMAEKAPARRRRARAVIHGSFKGGTNVQENPQKKGPDFLKIFLSDTPFVELYSAISSFEAFVPFFLHI